MNFRRAVNTIESVPANVTQPSPDSAASRIARGPKAETCTGTSSVTFNIPFSGLRKRTRRIVPSVWNSAVPPVSIVRTTPMYSSMSASFCAGRPIVLRPVKPVPTPKTTRPGASAFSEAKPFAATGAIRFVGMSTPVASLMRDVCSAASAIATNTSVYSSCES